MSWQPNILNLESSKLEEARRLRTEEINKDDILASNSNVVVVGGDRFICAGCNKGWTFARMKTVECCGITYFKDRG